MLPFTYLCGINTIESNVSYTHVGLPDIVYEANNGYEVNLSPTLRLNPKQRGE